MASSSKNIIGPSLPPECKEPSLDSSTDSDSSEDSSPGKRKRHHSTDDDDDNNGKIYGPAAPSGSKKKPKLQKGTIGPALPPGFQVENKSEASSESDSEVIGPQLPGTDIEHSEASAFERRAEMMKKKLLGKNEVIQTRETWMTELPDKLGSAMGLPVAKTRFGDGKKKMDRTGWTETPQDREKRQLEGRGESEVDGAMFEYNPTDRDREMQAAVDHLQTDRPKSLLEMHQKKLDKKSKKKDKKEKKDKKDKKKKKKKDKDKKSKKDKKDKKEKLATEPRRPFDRDQDLQANVFDNAKRNAIIKRSGQLNMRFASSGTQGQFL